VKLSCRHGRTGLGAMELRMRKAPSITPTDRLDRDMYLVLEDFRTGRRGARRMRTGLTTGP
jgi:hypothetical protein